MQATLTICGETTKVDITKSEYMNNKATALVATEADTGMPYCTLSTNLKPYSAHIPKTQCFIKTWSENEGLLEQLIAQKIVRYTSPLSGSDTKIIDRGTSAVLVDILF